MTFTIMTFDPEIKKKLKGCRRKFTDCEADFKKKDRLLLVNVFPCTNFTKIGNKMSCQYHL